MINILHVSDVHFGVNDPRGEQGLITDALINAVKSERLDPDVIIFSGDLAFSGTASQFKEGEVWLRRLCDAAPKADLFLVPGNHDVQRDKVAGPHMLHATGSNEPSFAEWKRSIKGNNPNHLGDFFRWIEVARDVLPLRATWESPYGFHYTKEGLERPLHIIGLNSALLSCSDLDTGRLVIDVSAATDGLRRSQTEPGIIVAVAHHPLKDLVDWNQTEVEKFLSQGTGADLFLHGHLHAQLGVATSDITGRSLVTLAAGAAYQGSNWPQQFAFYQIGERNMQVAAYTYSANSGEWISDNKLSGKILLDLPPMRQAGASKVGASRDPETRADHVLIETRSTKARLFSEVGEPVATIEESRTFVSIDYDISRHRVAARYVETEVTKYFGNDPVFEKVCYAIKHRVKSRDRIREKMQQRNIEDAHKVVDICGFRLITFFQSDIPTVVERLLKIIEFEAISPFSRGCSADIDINTSRTESDPLSISSAVQEVATRSGLKTKVAVRTRPTGYSSVHLIVSAPARDDDSDVREMFVEIQVRSAWEDIWGEIDHRLRYGFERGGTAVSSSQHLNVFKALIDGVVQYVDVIKLHSKSDDPKSPSAIKAERTIASPVEQLRLLEGLSPEILTRVEKAFDLWKQADASRQRGGDPGLLREAADSFANILQEFRGQPVAQPKLAEELEYVSETERAYLLMYTGDSYDLAQSAELYNSILHRRPKDATALFRLGIVRGRQKQHKDSDRLLSEALAVIESGEDYRLNIGHWTYDIVRLHLGLTRWRIFKKSGQWEDLASALKLARSVNDKLVDPANAVRAINDLVYYAYEERQITNGDHELLVGEVEYKELTNRLERELAIQERSYEYQDTLMSALVQSGRTEEARAVAIKLRDMLEQVAVLKAPGADLGKKGTYAWMAALIKILDHEDQQECLVHAQDVIASH